MPNLQKIIESGKLITSIEEQNRLTARKIGAIELPISKLPHLNHQIGDYIDIHNRKWNCKCIDYSVEFILNQNSDSWEIFKYGDILYTIIIESNFRIKNAFIICQDNNIIFQQNEIDASNFELVMPNGGVFITGIPYDRLFLKLESDHNKEILKEIIVKAYYGRMENIDSELFNNPIIYDNFKMVNGLVKKL